MVPIEIKALIQGVTAVMTDSFKLWEQEPDAYCTQVMFDAVVVPPVTSILRFAQETGLDCTCQVCETTLRLQPHITMQHKIIRAQLVKLISQLQMESSRPLFLYIPNRRLWDKPAREEWGQAAWGAFPNAHRDMMHSLYCLAAGFHTSSALHLCRALEWPVRGLWRSIHQGKPTPHLGKCIGDIRAFIKNSKIEGPQLFTDWPAREDFYDEANGRLIGLGVIRNGIVHAERVFEQRGVEQELALFIGFFAHVATRTSQSGKRK